MYKVVLLKPASDFIESANNKMQAKIARTIRLLYEFGPFLTMPHSKKLKGYDLYELRVILGNNIVRLFYGSKGNKFYVITSGYFKKQNKTDKKEIEKADKLFKQYLEENDGNN